MKVKMIVKGLVQGVGFRYTTKMKADELGIKGIVRNEWDGSVYIEAVGESETVKAFIEIVRRSPSPAGKVTDLKVSEDESIKNYTSFRVTN